MTKDLLSISFIMALLGILLLLILASQMKPPLLEIKNITNQSLNQKIMVMGNITNTRLMDNKTGFQLLTLKDKTGKITVTVTSPHIVNETNNVLVIGKVQEYEKDLQINADRISLLDQ